MAKKSITETGPKALKGIRNPDLYETDLGTEQQQYIDNLQYRAARRNYDAAHGHLGYSALSSTPDLFEVQQNPNLDYGSSMFDEGILVNPTQEDINNQRAENQPWYAKLGAGIGKGAMLAVSTFLDGTVGLVTGGIQAISEGRWSALWDNPVSNALSELNKASEEIMPNYYTSEELNSPWYTNIFSSNFFGDKLIKPFGFLVGAYYSGAAFTKLAQIGRLPQLIANIAKSTKAADTTSALLGSTIAAINEGRIEANNNSQDWFNLQKEQLDDWYKGQIADKYKPLFDKAAQDYENNKGSLVRDFDGNAYDPAYISYQETIKQLQDAMDKELANPNSNKIYTQSLAKITEDRLKMGNADFLMNIPLLTYSNWIQFGKLFGGGYKTARRVKGITRDNEGLYSVMSPKARKAWAAIKGPVSEGTEEMTQSMASSASGNYYSVDVSNFHKAQIDPNAEQETLSWGKALSQAINENVNNGSSWEEFFIGAVMGAVGMPKVRSMRDADGNLRSPITFDAGAYGEYKDKAEQIEREQEIADYMNSRMQSPEFQNYYRGLIRHRKYQRDMDKAKEEGNEFDFKNAEHAQFVSDIVMFDKAGKLDDLVAMIDAATGTSDENLNAIIELTTEEVDGKKVGPFADIDMSSKEGKEELIKRIEKSREDVLNTIKDYKKVKNDIAVRTGDILTEEQLSEVTWIQSQINNWSKRAEEMTPLVREALTNLSDNLESTLAQALGEASVEGESVEDTGKAYDVFGIGADRIQNIRKLLLYNDKKLQAILTNPKNKRFVEGVIEDISKFGSDIINYLDRENVTTIMRDLVKVGEGIETYNNKLEEYLTNPNKLTEDQIQSEKEIEDEVNAQQAKDIRTKLSNAQSVNEISSIMSNAENQEIAEGILKDLENGGNRVVKNYRAIKQYNDEIKEALANSELDEQTLQDALTLWEPHSEKAEDLGQIAYPNSVYLNDESTFLDSSNGDANLAEERFQNARYAVQRAMSKVNNDIKFAKRFSDEYKAPVNGPIIGKGVGKGTTGGSGTSTAPSVPVGDITAEMVTAENSDANERVETQRTLDQSQEGQRKYYRPVIPELHIDASKEGDFRPFDVVVAEREAGVDFSGIYSYLRDNGAFSYVNAAKLKPGDTLGFMIDPEFNDHTIFLVDTRNNQIVGSIDESEASVARYEGLENLIKKVRDEFEGRNSWSEGDITTEVSSKDGVTVTKFNRHRSDGRIYTGGGISIDSSKITEDSIENIENIENIQLTELREHNGKYAGTIRAKVKDGGYTTFEVKFISNPIEGATIKTSISGKFFATPQTRVSKMMVGRIPYSTEERSLADIPGVIDGDTKPILGVIKNGVLTTNEKIDDRLIIKPVDMAQKEGRLYLLISNAAGTYSPAAVRVKHFNTQEFNLDDATVAATPIGKGINEALDKLADATSQDDVSTAMKELAQDIYMQDVMVTWFDAKAGSGIVVSKKVRKPDGTYEMVTINGQEQIKEEKTTIYFQNSKRTATINGMEVDIEAAKDMGADLSLFGQPRDTADIRKDILNTILRYNLPLQVSVSKINDSGYNNRVIKSNILTSNLREAKVIGSWFTTDYFDNQGNLQKAVNPASVKPTLGKKGHSPVGGTEGVVQGTRVFVSGVPYIVDLKHSIAVNEKTGERKAFSAFNSQSLIDLAWAQENFGDATESSIMTENKIITPKGDVLDRNTGHYITGEEAQRIKDKIEGRNREAENRIAQSKRVIADIYENQKKVDKTRTDKDYYYILEEDGQYHQYSRVHSRLGDNWLGERTETENSKRALEAGTAVDKVIRDFFTSKETPTRPEILSESAFIDLISRLTEIKSKMEQLGETFMTNNIVLFQKYADGTRVAGEVDILSVNKNGDFKIYDAKTSGHSFSDKYFTEKSSMQRMSTKDYYTLQLSAYQNLFESQYGVRPTRLAILPFVLTYGSTQATTIDIPSGTQTKLGMPIGGNQSYFRTDRKVDDDEARFVSSEKDGKIYFKPILDTKAHEATLKSTDAAKSAVEFTGGDPKEATSFVLIEPGEARRNPENGRLMVSKKAKVFAVTPSTPYSGRRDIVTSISQEQGIPITYNPAVNVPLASAVKAPHQQNSLPIFDSTIETMITNPEEQNRVLPENAFEEGGEIGYYEKDGKLYTGYLKKIGEIEVTYESGQKDMVPIHVTKVRDIGFGRAGEFGSTSEYITVFPNGKAISTKTNDTNDDHAAEIIMNALSAKPEKVLALSNEKTQIHNPEELEESDAAIRTAQESTPQGGASQSIQKNDSINQHDDEFEDDLVLRAVDSTRPVWNRERELAWLEKVLPQLSEQDRIKVVKGLIQVAENGPVAWGMFSDGIITLSDIAAEGTTYHEAFHVVFNLMLTAEERESLLAEARQLYGDKSELSLEEDMAEGFREYIASQESRGLGRKILDFFKNLFAKITNWKYTKPSLNAYYRMIDQGKYRKSNLGISNTTRLRQEEFTPEMQSIKDKAISNGTFMKAPNGNPTNLNERQWLQVRTKAFKKWFGDWETANKENPYNKDISIGFPEADFNNVDGNGIGALIPVFLNGEYIGETGLDNALYHKDKGMFIKGIYMEMPSVGGNNISIEKEYRGKGYGKAAYFELAKFAANNGKILRSAPDSSRTPASTRVWESLVRDGYAKKVNDRYEIINSSLTNASKVVDENGEPLVVYHNGADNIHIFKGDEYGNIYFGDPVTSASYGGSETEVFLNIKSPIIIEGNNQEIGDVTEQLYGTRRISPQGKNDGIIYNHVKDVGEGIYEFDYEEVNRFWSDYEKQGYGTVYSVNKPNQIKSATSNIGEFSTTNDDIRYREVDINDSEFKDLRQDLTSFFNNFGITIKDTSKFDSEEPIFNALDRVINFNSIESLTDNAGYAIAFMMQYNPKIKDLISIKQLDSPVKMKGLRRAVNKGKRYDFRSLTEREYKSLDKTPYLREIGKDIGEQLRLLYSKKTINTSDSSFKKLWSAISEFFKKMTPETRLKFNVIRNYTNSIANAVKLGDYTIIRKSDFKPGTDTLPSIVDIGEAFKKNPYEESIVYTLNKHGISLAGGAAIASQGTLYRPSENPLHDLDFEARDKSKGEIESILRDTFKAYSHTNTIVNENGRVTYTYLVMDREFEERRDVPGIGVNVIYDKRTGERLGTRIHSELVIEKEGVKGKMLDFFTGDTTNVFDNVTINYNGKNYLFSDYRNAMSFKINVARLKDIFDYNRFIPRDENGKIVSLAKFKNSDKERVQNLVKNARIIWGHPAIGKTTYLERNNDILEWDKEVNPKRDTFVRDQIDPNHTMDVNSTEYKRLKQEYMSNWENNSVYIEFLTREWNKLKDRAQRENKRLFASPLPLLSIFRNDFDLVVALPEKQFIERNKARGGSEVGSLSWKQALDRQLVGIDTNKIVYTDKYFSEFMRDTLGVTWGTLNNAELEALQARGWSEEKFNSISQEERDQAVECVVL